MWALLGGFRPRETRDWNDGDGREPGWAVGEFPSRIGGEDLRQPVPRGRPPRLFILVTVVLSEYIGSKHLKKERGMVLPTGIQEAVELGCINGYKFDDAFK